MISRKTYTVESCYVGRDKVQRVYVKGHVGALIADEPFKQGDAVVIQGDRAVRS